jgi:uncharacterized protein YdeI (YjbR/CyaY-like superfamily)
VPTTSSNSHRAEAIYFASAAAFRAWLAKHHANAPELLVGFHKRGTGKPTLTWPESVDEALCFGWIDGVRRGVDVERYTIRFTPRRARSIWSNKNIARMTELIAAGKVKPAGLRAFEARSPDRSGVYSFEQRRALALTPAQQRQLARNKRAAAFFAAQAPWYQRAAVHWIVSAKREETRASRLATLIEDSAAARLIKPLARPKRTS